MNVFSFNCLDDVDEKEDDKKLLNDNSLGMLNDTAELTLHKQLAAVENGTCEKLAWRAVEVREHFRMVWKNDAAFFKKLFPLFDCDVSYYFILFRFPPLHVA